MTDEIAADIVRIVANAIRVLRTRDGVEISESQILHQARNAAHVLINTYAIQEIDDEQD